ncbi:MAG TPA: cytochrome b N-terminal domain-containing protein [Planctomycetota bacterium]|jgi:quinol-cytochrome oxidoreductase complex cytochrome b subunit
MSWLGDKFRSTLDNTVYNSVLWKSIFRHGYPDTDRNRALTVFSNVLLHLHPVKVRAHALRLGYSWCMGGLSAFMFVVLTVTGVLLMFYYHPSPDRAYADMMSLREDVPLGRFMRNLHRWSAHAMVALVFLHMLRVFLTGSYKAPRQMNWCVGVGLLVMTLLLSFTGYLLPWDQTALAAVSVGTNMAGATPLIGHEGPAATLLKTGEVQLIHARDDIRFLLLGGSSIGPAALLRFYVLHCVLLPVMAVVLLVVHFWRVRKDGFSGPL